MRDMDTLVATDAEWKEIMSAGEEEDILPSGKTRQELQKIWGLRKSAAVQKISILYEKGLIRKGTRYITTTTGARLVVPSYEIVKGKHD